MEKQPDIFNKWLILFVVVLGLFMENLDSSIVNLAISKMMHTFNTTLDKIQWRSDIHNVVLLIIGCYSLLIFIINELMIPEPLLDLRILKNITFGMGAIINNIAIATLCPK